MQRQFTSGSRQAPDPFDQFLEEHHFYRKHTARDASCLFRVISEQMYDTQLHHLMIRKKCIRYMRKQRQFFELLVERDFDEYLDDLSKQKTYGTLIELQAVGYMFHRNVLLFEPFNLGNVLNNRSYFSDVFRVFYTPEHHFDSVFTCDYIKTAAICQSICYEVLYKDFFMLPDVSFAVEQMLHSPTFEAPDDSTEYNEDGYCMRIHLADGRVFDLDLPENTNCILENHKLCHFHYTNFPRLSDDLQRELKVYTNRDECDRSALNKTAESLLPNKYMSCVRQLLQEGITPFPYKVAKALDPNMYRNIEFDAWNEARKELKLQNFYNGDSNFKVGAKCHVKLRKSENDLYTCHIQEIAMNKGYCVVFIEQLGEKRLVPYNALSPLPPDQFQPWALPYRSQRHMQKYSSVRFTRQHYNYRFKFNGQFSTHEYCSTPPNMKSEYGDADEDSKQHYAHHNGGSYYKLKQYTEMENFRTSVEYCTMPLTVENPHRELELKAPQHGSATPSPSIENSRSTSSAVECAAKLDDGSGGAVEDANTAMENYEMDHRSAYLPEYHCFYPMPRTVGAPEEFYYDGSIHPPAAIMPGSNGAFYYMCPGAPGYPAAVNNLNMPSPQPQPLFAASTPHGGSFFLNPYSGVGPTSGGPSVPTNNAPYNSAISTRGRGCYVPTTPLNGRINWDVKKSVKPNGNDLPTDVATLRYFYNLGLDYHHKNISRNNEDYTNVKDTTSKLSADMQNIKLDENDNQQECKSDSNNNKNLNVQSNQQRRFASRYFNNKDGGGYQRSNTGSAKSQQNRGQNYNNKILPNPTATPNSSRSVGVSPRPGLVTEQGIQISPSMNCYDAAANMSADDGQTLVSYNNSTPNSVFAYDSNAPIPTHLPPAPTPGLFIQMPITRTGYGIYGPPPPPPVVSIHPAAGGTYHAPYMGPPPSSMSMHGNCGAPPAPNAFYATPTVPQDSAEIAGSGISNDSGMLFQCMAFPPPMPIYYSTNTSSVGIPIANGAGDNPSQQPPPPPASAASGGVPPPHQGYWCVPPNMMPTQPPPSSPSQTNSGATTTSAVGGGSVAATNNRRDKLQPSND